MLQWIQFSAAAFAIAGLVFAIGPVLIHLLNRRRFRVVQWAAMDFLREALQRNRRILQFRDLLLLLMRCAAIILFGLALAQPYLSVKEEEYDSSQPLHAVLVIDNSMSMGYVEEGQDISLLGRAKDRAAQFIDDLPRGSQISIVPLCGSVVPISLDPYRNREDAVEALQRIDVVDRAGNLELAANQARRAGDAGPQLAKRNVFFSDQQKINLREKYTEEDVDQMPPMQLVDVSVGEPENTWIAGVEVQDGVADVVTPATLIVRIGHLAPDEPGRVGSEPPKRLPVTLSVDGVDVNTKIVNLEPGVRAREVTFRHTFDSVQPDPGRPVFMPVKVSIPPDRLAADDEYHFTVPVVAALPVVFLDELSPADEDPIKGQIGETFHLRRLLAPVTGQQDATDQLVQIRHANMDAVAPDVLMEMIRDARLVVIGGVESPSKDAVGVLREYVQQGGQLLIAAGGRFNPELWNAVAWNEGAGILPAPLLPTPLGTTLADARESTELFGLDNTDRALLFHDYFLLADNSPQQLVAMYDEPLFSKAVQCDVSEETVEKFIEAEQQRLRENFESLKKANRRDEPGSDQDDNGPTDEPGDGDGQQEDWRPWQAIRPQWITFAQEGPDVYDTPLPDVPAKRDQRLRQLAEQTGFRVVARLNNGLPYLVERPIGRGRVLFVASSVSPEWNTLPKTYAMAVFDRILRSMIESTLPRHNYPPAEEIEYAVGGDRNIEFALYRPGRELTAEAVDAGFVGAEKRAVTIPNALTRGVYQLNAYSPVNGGRSSEGRKLLWKTYFAVNGPPHESDLTPMTEKEFQALQLGDRLGWVGLGDTISLAGSQVRGQNWWIFLIIVVLLLLFVELLLLGWPVFWQKQEEAVQ